MQTNPFNYQVTFYSGGKISCQSKSANYHMVAVLFDTNTSIIFTGAGVDTMLKTASGATEFYVPASSGIKKATIIFLSHPVIAINPPYVLDKSVQDPSKSDHPYGTVVGIASLNDAAKEECVVVININ